jgi:hypothetical protein
MDDDDAQDWSNANGKNMSTYAVSSRGRFPTTAA